MVEIQHVRKILEKLASEWKGCEGDLRRQKIDCRAEDITFKYCSSDMVTNMRKYYETLKWRKLE